MLHNYCDNISMDMKIVDKLDALQKKLDSCGLKLDEAQLGWFAKTAETAGKKLDYLPFRTTLSYLDAALSADRDGREALLKQIIPDIREFDTMPYELSDPLGEKVSSPFPRFVHRYKDRALFLVTDNCAMFCRHCFRRSFSGQKSGSLSDEQLSPMLAYLKEHTEIKEVLLSGGDPLTLSNSRLERIITGIRGARSDMIIRLCSRMPVVAPDRIDQGFTDILSGFGGIWFVTHCNHPAELTPAVRGAFRKMVKSGIPVLNQTVLLRGVNDDLQTLAKLFRELLSTGVKPYYLFQGDLAAGTSHLRVPLDEALDLTGRLKKEVSGMAMPRFAVDLPGGGGKITLPSESHPIKADGDFYIIKGFDNNEEYRYPAKQG